MMGLVWVTLSLQQSSVRCRGQRIANDGVFYRDGPQQTRSSGNLRRNHITSASSKYTNSDTYMLRADMSVFVLPHRETHVVLGRFQTGPQCLMGAHVKRSAIIDTRAKIQFAAKSSCRRVVPTTQRTERKTLSKFNLAHHQPCIAPDSRHVLQIS